MRISPAATCLWPGLAQLWFRGRWSALVTAVLFALAVNLVLVANFIWPELLPAPLARGGCLAVIAVWIACSLRTFQLLPTILRPAQADDEGLFIQAQDEYLKGHWREAESLLRRIVTRCRHDVEAQLLLATMYRHTRRFGEAGQRLRALQRLEGAEQWRTEIEHERMMLRRLADANKEDKEEKANPALS